MLKIRSGIGYDLHRIESGNNGLIIGGIQISNDIQFVAHSDGDILIHALIDSLLGAIGEKDIGELFPDSDSRYKGIASTVLLNTTIDIVNRKNYEIVNIDSILIAEKPRIAPFKDIIRKNLAKLMKISIDDINIKAKTKEKVDAVGRGEAIECFCICMIRNKI